MMPISYARHRFPPDVIRHTVWLYLRFTLSYRDVEDLLAERGLMISIGIDLVIEMIILLAVALIRVRRVSVSGSRRSEVSGSGTSGGNPDDFAFAFVSIQALRCHRHVLGMPLDPDIPTPQLIRD
jgi:hypothetical protein